MADENKPAENGISEQIQAQLSGLIQKNDAREQTIAALQSGQSELAAALNQINSKLDAVASRPATPTAAGNPLESILGGQKPQESTPAVAPTDIASAIKAAVAEAVNPLVEDINATKQQSALSRAQNVSYQRAVAGIPELKDPNSATSQVFAQLIDGRPDLQALPDGPELAAQIARGIVASNKTEVKEQIERKAAAAVDQSQSRPPSAIPRGLPDDYEQAGTVVEELTEKGATQGLNSNEWKNLVGTALAKGISEQLDPSLAPSE